MGKGSNTTTTSQNSTYTPTGSPYINTALSTAQSAASTPYQAYGGELTAPVNAQQQTGISGINANANLAQPYYNTAQSYATNAGAPLTAAQIQQYQNPYTQDVVNATQAQFNNQNAQQQNQVIGNAAAQGALGGDRVGVAQAQTAGQQQLAQAPVIAGLYNQSYAQGLQTAQQQQAQQGNAGAILGSLGTGAQGAALSGAGAQVGAGSLEQQTSQAQDTAQYQQYLNALAYPFQTSQFLTSAVGSLAPALGGTTAGQGTTTGPTPNIWNSILGGAATAASFLPSDERVKENIEKIGKLFDGTNIYRFQYKGDPTTRIGLIAQEVEKKTPDAVAHSSDGLKAVDHHRATEDAAGRQHFAGGGLALPYSNSSQASSPFQGYVPTSSGFQVSQAPSGPQLPKMTPGQAQPDNTNSMVKSAMGIGSSLKNSSIFNPQNTGGYDPSTGQANPFITQSDVNSYPADWGVTGTNVDDSMGVVGGAGDMSVPTFGGFDANRGGRVKGYDDGGYVPDAPEIKVTQAPTGPGLPNISVPKQQQSQSGGLGPMAAAGNSFAGLLGGSGGAGAGAAGAAGADAAGAGASAAGAEGSADLLPLLLLAKRGGRIKGYDGGGAIQPDADPYGTTLGDVSPGVFADPNYSAPTNVAPTLAEAAHLDTGAPMGAIPESAGFNPPSGMAGLGNGAPVGALPASSGFAPAPASGLASLGNGAPVGPIPTSDGFAPTQSAATTAMASADEPSGINAPRGIRNNNPGNIEDGKFAQSQPGYAGSDGRFAIFESPQAGSSAASNLIGAYGNKGINTISGIINRWAPAADNNNTSAYIAAVSKATGIPSDQPIDTSDPAVRNKIASAIGQFENGAGGTSRGTMLASNYNRSAGLGPSQIASDEASIPPKAGLAQAQGNQSWAERHGLTNPFGQSLTPQSGANSGANSDSGSPSWWPFGKLSDATKQQLMATGFGMMASKSPFLGQAIGEGGQAGISTVQKAQELSRQADLARSEIGFQTAQTGKTNVETQAAQENLNALRELRGLPPVNIGSASPPNSAAVAATPKSGLAGILPTAGTAANAQENPQQNLQAVTNAVSRVAGIQQTAQGPVAVDRAGKPVMNPNDLLTMGNRYIRSGIPGFQAAGEKMLGLYDTMITKGVTTDQNGNVIPLPGAAETAARGAGMKAGEEARAKFPYEYYAQLARNAGRAQTVGPNQVVTTAEQINPDIRAATRLANSLMPGGPGSAPDGTPPSAAAGQSTQPVVPGQSASQPQLGIPSSGPNVSQFTPHLVQNPDGSYGSSVTPGVEALQKDAAAGYEKSRDTALASQNMKYQLNLVEHDLNKLNDQGPAWYNSGTGANGRLEFAKAINSYAAQVGMNAPFDTAKVGAWEDLTKESTRLGFATARTLGAREAMQIVQQAITANPGMANTPAGARLVLNSIRYAAKSDTDFYNYATKFAQEHGGDLIGAQTAFYKDNPPSMYANAALAAGNAPLHVANLKAHPETADKFDSVYGKGTAAIILGE